MSGIYIPGMEMPTDENVAIDIRLFPDGNIAAWDKQKGWIHYIAIHVPDHGGLIDVDELEEEGADVHEDVICCGYVEDTIWGFSYDMVRNAPTVIPADKE